MSASTAYLIVQDHPLSHEELTTRRQAAIALSRPKAQPRLDDYAHLSTVEKGKLGEVLFEAECIRRKIEVAKPIFDCRYDYIMRVDGAFKRVRIKWADSGREGGLIKARLLSVRPRKKGPVTAYYTQDEVDLIICFVPCVAKFVLFDHDTFHNKSSIILHIDEPRNKQRSNTKRLDDYIW